ncbi:MAG: NAD(P)H-binding protein [Myxococcota bacterium]|nr:NAD(P)H-binding protein [Myxococcota bacterium]
MSVAVYGATGFTGRLVLQELRKRSIPTRAVGRDAGRLRALEAEWTHAGGTAPPLEIRTADAAKPNRVRAALEGAEVVIACAGPFTEVGDAAVEAALSVGAHYLDSTGEQDFVRRTRNIADERARDQGLAVVNAMAFEVAPSDMAAGLLARDFGPLDDLRIAYCISSGGTSRGTRRSMLRAAETPWGFREGRPVTERLAAQAGKVRFPSPPGLRSCVSIPGAEIITVPQHVDTRRCICLMAVPAALGIAARAGGGLVSPLLRSPAGGWLRDRASGGSSGPREEDRKRTRFTILVEAFAGRRFRQAVIEGVDPYGLTAVILAQAAEGLATGRDTGKRGALAPAEIFEPQTFLEELGAEGLTVRLYEGQVEER